MVVVIGLHALPEMINAIAIAGAQQYRLSLTLQLTEKIQVVQVAYAAGGQVQDGRIVVHHYVRTDRRNAGKLERFLIGRWKIRVEIKISV